MSMTTTMTIQVIILFLHVLLNEIYVHSFPLRHRHAYVIVKPKILQCHIGESNHVHVQVAHSKGLLSGIDDTTKAEFYSDNISIKGSYELLKDRNHLYNICLKIAGGNIASLDKNLKNINDKACQNMVL